MNNELIIRSNNVLAMYKCKESDEIIVFMDGANDFFCKWSVANEKAYLEFKRNKDCNLTFTNVEDINNKT